MVPGLVLASLSAAPMRSRSRCHTSSGNAGSPISRAASATALSSSAGCASVRSVKLMRSMPAPTPNIAPRSAQASPSAFWSSAGSQGAVVRATGAAGATGAAALTARPASGAGAAAAGAQPLARTPFSTMPAVTLARPACSGGSRRLPASKSICTSTIGSAWVLTR